MNELYKLTVYITVQAPFIVQGSEPGPFSLDAMVMRGNNRPIIPGSLLVGRIKELWLKTPPGSLEQSMANDWFGGVGKDFQPAPGRLVENDLVFLGTEKPSTQLFRVTIDAETQSAKPGHLLMIEQPWSIGEALEFEGHWYAHASEQDAMALGKKLEKSLLWLSQLGAYASVGFGIVLKASVKPTKVAPANGVPKTAQTGRYYFHLSTETPVLIPKLRGSASNVFDGEAIIPGSALKAAVAQTWNARRGAALRTPLSDPMNGLKFELGKAFDEVQFSFAIPATEHCNRPTPLPLSVAAFSIDGEGGKLFTDLAKWNEVELVGGYAPVFATNWKHGTLQKIYKEHPKLTPGATEKHLRVRTAMNEGIASESQLFSHSAVTAPRGWYGWVDVSQTDGSITSDLLQVMSHSILYLGKLKTRVTLQWLDSSPGLEANETGATPFSVGNEVAVSLVTPALLNSILKIDSKDRDSLFKSYSQYWNEQSDGGLELVRFFAQQELAGGQFAAKYRKGKRDHYLPWLVTQAGSVFVVRIVSAIGANKLTQWQSTGLPIGAEVKECYDDNWKENPYQPQNGFGEIVIEASAALGLPSLSARELNVIYPSRVLA